jgi:hypothetical protein
MQRPNRRITEAAEKSAKAETRIAASKEKLVRHFDEFMRICDGDDVEAPERLGAKTIPPKSQPPRK